MKLALRKINLICVILGLVSVNIARAQSYGSGTGSSKARVDSYGNLIHHGWAPYLGLGAGYSSYNSNLDVEGAPTSVKVLGSYVSPESMGVFDLGIGFQNQTFSQEAAMNRDISTGVIEAAARYQFENRWQLGGVLNQVFNKGDNYGANQGDVQFGGVQLLREIGFAENYFARVGGRLMTSLNVNSESVNMVILELQLGWGGIAKVASPGAHETTNLSRLD